MKKWTSLGVDNMMVVSFLIFVSVISKLIKPCHCRVYGSCCYICLCINANKDVWLVLSGMMAISSGKNVHKFFCCGCTRTKVDSLFVLFSSAQWRLIFMLWFVHHKVTLLMVTHFFTWEKRLRCYGDSLSPSSWVPFVFSLGFFTEGIMREFHTRCCVSERQLSSLHRSFWIQDVNMVLRTHFFCSVFVHSLFSMLD